MKKVYCVYTTFLLIYMEYKKSSACLNEQVESLSDIPKRLPSESSNYWSGGNDPVLSDDGLEQQWYRAVHDGYQYLMVDSNNKPDQQYCSTYYPVYLKGTHPSVESLTETARSFVACQTDYFYPCSVNYDIKIRRCGTEVQYYLPPTQQYNAFCFQVGEKVQSNEMKTTTAQQTTNTYSPSYTTYPTTTLLSSEQNTSPTRQITREQTTVQQTTDTDSLIYTSYSTTAMMSSEQTTKEPTTVTTGYERTDDISTFILQTLSEQNIQTSQIPRESTITYYETSVASTSKSTQVPWEQITQTTQSTILHSQTTYHETHYTLPPTTIDVTTEERRTPSKEPLTSGATETVTTEPSTQEELTSYHTTFTKLEDATDSTNLETTAQQHVEEAVGDDNSKIIIILTVCMGLLVVTIIGLVVVIVCRKRKASRKEIKESNVSAETKADDDHKYDTPSNIYHTVAERGSAANPYESLRDVRELEMNKSEYDVLTPDDNYQTLDYDRMPREDEHCYQTLP